MIAKIIVIKIVVISVLAIIGLFFLLIHNIERKTSLSGRFSLYISIVTIIFALMVSIL